MIEIEFKPEANYRLTVSGHAKSGPKGEDVICGAVTILLRTLHKSLELASEMLQNGSFKCEMESGRTVIECEPKAEFEGNIGLIYWVTLNGLQMVAEQFPEYVTVKA